MTPQDIIDDARKLIQDTVETYRYDDAFMLSLVNQALKRMVVLRPDLFAFVGTVACVAGTTIQAAPADSVRIIEVYSIVGGGGVVEVTREALDQTVPSWRTDTAGAAVNWMRNVRNPNNFFIYPQAPANQTLVVEYAQAPADYTIDATITLLSNAYRPVVTDIVVYLAESIDNESVTSGRAKLFQDAYTQALGLSLQSRVVLDLENSGSKGEVV